MTSTAPEVLLLDDQLAVRGGIELLLRGAGFRIAGLGGTVSEASGLLRRRRFDVALLDSVLEGAPTAPLLAEVLAERPGLGVCVWAGRDGAALAQAAAAHPPGLVLRASAPEVLLAGLHAVGAGGRFRDPAVDARLPEGPVRPVRHGIALLSPREREILMALAAGHSGADIAAELFLSTETVRTHVRNAQRKLGARTRTQAVALLVEDAGGLTPTPAMSSPALEAEPAGHAV